MVFVEGCHAIYAFNGVSTVILFQKYRRLQMSCWLPRVVAFGVAKPLDQVLQLSPSPLTSVAVDSLDFVLFCTPHEVRWRSGVIFSAFFCFAIRGKERGVKHRVDGPLMGEHEFVCHRRYHLSDGKGAMPSWGKFH